MEPFQDTSRPESTCDPSDISHLDTHTWILLDRVLSVTSSLADSDLKSALAESQLKDIVVKKFSDNKPDNPRLGFCDFLKVEVVQLTSGSYDEFQQETFNLSMRLKRRDKQQQRYQHRVSIIMAQTVTYSQASMSHHYRVSHTDAGPTSADATEIYTRTARTSTAAVTAFAAALSTDIYSAACTSSTADPWTGSTAKHAATATLASDVSATAADAAAAGHSTTSFHTIRAGNTAAAAATANPNTSANTAKAAVHTTAASSTNCPKFTAAAHTTTQSANITAANVAEHHLITAACHVVTRYNARH